MPWILQPGALKRERERNGLTLVALSEQSQVQERTIVRLESGTQPTIRVNTLRDLAKALRCEVEILARWVEKQSGASEAKSVPVHPWVAMGYVKPRRLPPPPADVTPPPLSEAALADIFVAFRANKESAFLVTARVQAQFALTRLERIALRCLQSAGARFVVALDGAGDPAPVTLYTRSDEATTELQSALRAGAAIAEVARVPRQIWPSEGERCRSEGQI